ncbi:MoaD family protein [Ferroglobus placidus DSM 10642]|uniref:MoaD family protein n=1 Tax=Ferroglobus placidus (strain DSM 10642 / AEDII12DO) TaxID=589924 RepID=D3S0H2_FERPA|nr:ubiquitin-like small modifier protein 1 [Ferroglobus placidus]ADC66235.1 MoaD family protein [Ferroglobus placidus DSM 10642]
MKVKFKLYASLRRGRGTVEVEFKGKTLRDALRELFKIYPDLSEIVERDRVKEFYKIFVNGRDVEHLEGLDTELKEGDEIAIFPPIAGGLNR